MRGFKGKRAKTSMFATEEWRVNGMPLDSDAVGQAAWKNYGNEARNRAVSEMDRTHIQG